MKKSPVMSLVAVFALLAFIALGCNFSTANMSSLKLSKDAGGSQEASSFTAGDTIYANATISNNPGKVSVKFKLTAETAEGMTSGEVVKGSEVSVELNSDGVAKYQIPVPEGAPAGTYKLTADMHNDSGERKDGKTAMLTIK